MATWCIALFICRRCCHRRMKRWPMRRKRYATLLRWRNARSGETLLDLAFFEFDMLAQDGIIFLDREFFRHGARVLLGDIKEAGLAFAVEANLGGGGLGHGETPEEPVEKGGFWGKGRPLSSGWRQYPGIQRFFGLKRVFCAGRDGLAALA